MSVASAQVSVDPPSERGQRPLGLWLTALVYALAAFGPIPLYYYYRSALPDENWAGTTPFDQYLGTGLLYHGSAAVACWLLMWRRAIALWPAAFIVVWVGLVQIAELRHLLAGRHTRPLFGAGYGVLVVMLLLALYVRRLRERGVLR